MSLVIAATVLAAAAPAEPMVLEHTTRVEHAGTALDVYYRTRVSVAHRQLGMPTKGGTPSTLRCDWRANVAIEREARHGSGSLLTRTIEEQGVVQGSRAGWCSTHRHAIARDVARQEETLRGHVQLVAQRDEPALRAEMERLNRAG